MVEFLIRNGASVEFDPEREIWISPLSTALMVYDQFKYPFTVEVVRLLISNGAKVTHEHQNFIKRSKGDLKKLLKEYYQE